MAILECAMHVSIHIHIHVHIHVHTCKCMSRLGIHVFLAVFNLYNIVMFVCLGYGRVGYSFLSASSVQCTVFQSNTHNHT